MQETSSSGSLVAEVRNVLGVTGIRVAAEIGLSKASLSRLERGHRPPRPGELARLIMVAAQLATEDSRDGSRG